MKKYKKMLLAISQPELNCYGPKNEFLFIADDKDKKKGLSKLRSDSHYFVTLNHNRQPSEFGVVKELDSPITAKELAEKDYNSRGLDLQGLNEEIIKEYEEFLSSINSQPAGTPMAVTWAEKVFPKPHKYLRVHKVFFRDLTSEEKEEIFNS
ncbi:hypothetical protein ACRC6Q_08475 [Planococcus sp. SE5232]|uniref:hypothetical protein n=1 Tax=unclassified Planococcus (in: firmicutes) TaxID=2662419 RepID=UPI003D6AFFC8